MASARPDAPQRTGARPDVRARRAISLPLGLLPFLNELSRRREHLPDGVHVGIVPAADGAMKAGQRSCPEILVARAPHDLRAHPGQFLREVVNLLLQRVFVAAI